MYDLTKAVEKNRALILDAAQFIWEHPETGYKEFQTSTYLENAFIHLGYDVIRADGITGFYTRIDTGRSGPEVLILGELDSIICPNHEAADPKTGAVHACGHHAQCAALLGIAAVLKEPGILDKFSGRIRLCAVPAEELLEIEYRTKLKKEGKIKYYGGKSEFLYRGYFDGVDMAFMVHSGKNFCVRAGSVGCVAKNITYKGSAAHAGGSPWNGRNALYAATCGLNALNAIRETFKEQDCIRVHPIITHGGDMVNAIPETVRLESYVRGSSFEAIRAANKKVNQALTGAALSIGTNIEIMDIPGYAPLTNDPNMITLACDAAALAVPEYKFTVNPSVGTGSTDMGDLSCIMPVVHPYCAGSSGATHGSDYIIADTEAGYIANVKFQLAMLLLLLGSGAQRATGIVADFKPIFATKKDYFTYVDAFNSAGDRITYYNNGTAEVKID